MEGSGITPVMNMNPGYGGDGMFGNEGIWLFAILALMWGGFGNNRFGPENNFMTDRPATANDVTQASNFAALERQNNEGVAATRQVGYDLQTAIKDANYSTLSELRDIQASVAEGNAQSQRCCCEILRGIDGVNYNAAMNTASINATTTAQTQKILDALSADKISALQGRINQLELQSALCGVVRYPTQTTFTAQNPFCCYSYGCNGNI